VNVDEREAVMVKTDWEQICELMATYANAIDAKDYAGIADCFTDDASATYGDFSETLQGRAAITAHMERSLAPLDATHHVFGNFIVDAEGDAGRLSASIIARHERRGAPGGDSYLAGNRYKVEVRRAAGAWKIAQAAVGPVMWSEGNRDLLPRAGG
jgi:uncharacterized protein (TIGR02246 family)